MSARLGFIKKKSVHLINPSRQTHKQLTQHPTHTPHARMSRESPPPVAAAAANAANAAQDAMLTTARMQALDSVVRAAITKMVDRAEVGHAKYGHTMDRKDLNVRDWIQHAQEEAMDFVLYLEKLKSVVGSSASTPLVIDDEGPAPQQALGREVSCLLVTDTERDTDTQDMDDDEPGHVQTPATPGSQ
eukprot:1567238-Rhodomonas_salina.2